MVFLFSFYQSFRQIWYYELTPPSGKNYTRINSIKDEDLDDAYKKWQKRKISENSWIVKVEDIIKRDYDLSAKNLNKIKGVACKKPEELIKSAIGKEKEIEEILEEVKDII